MIPLRDDNVPSRTPIVTRTFVGLCVLVYLWQMTLGPQGGQAAVYALGVIPAVLLGRETLPAELAIVPPSLTMLTSMFMHGGFMHLLGNMLYLWIFGDNVEDSMTRTRYLFFYLLCGVAAVLAQALPAPNSTIPMVGASGAISGVLVALWFVLQLLSNLFASGEGGVAFRAHIGGFIAGMLLIPLFKRKDVPLRSLLGGR